MLYPRAIGYSAGAINYFIKGFAEIDKTKEQEKQLSFLQKVEKGARGLLDNISYIWGDTFLAVRNTTTDDWNKLTGATGETYDFSQLVYESGKEAVAGAARKSADAFADIGGQVLSAAEIVAESVKHPLTVDELLKIKQATADDKNKTDGKTSQSSCGRDCDATKRNSAQDNGKEQNNNGGAKKDTPQSSCGRDCVGKETSQSSCGRDCDATKIPPTPLAKGRARGTGSFFSGGSSAAIDQEIKDIAVKADAIIPSIEIIAKPAAVSSSTAAVFLFSVNNEKDFQCRLDSAEWQICQKQISFQDLSQGTHSLKLLAISKTGDIASSSYDWLIEITIPTAKIILSHIVISEIYFNATNNGSEWIELYNPTEDNVSIGDWMIDTKTDDADATLPANAVIIKNGYYLIGDLTSGIGWNPDNINWPTPDHIETITLNNSGGWLRLKNSASEIIDSVGWKKSGTVDVYETAPLNIAASAQGQSIERKAEASSTAELMASGGAHELSGNGYDADNNQNDFIIRLIPDPQNSQSPIEPREPVIAEAVGDLIISHPFTGSNSITLHWTAPKNAIANVNARYDLRYQIKNNECDLNLTWDSVTAAASTTLPVPGSEGAAQEVKITGLDQETEYCFALKTFNGAAWSDISNQAEAKTLPDIVSCSIIPVNKFNEIKINKLLLNSSPYCSNSDAIIIKQGASLTIEPGVVVKLNENRSIKVLGELKAIGLPGLPVVFTSYYDNEKGGKCSDSEHAASAGDWGNISVGGNGKLTMDNSIVSYGGLTMLACAMYQLPPETVEEGAVYIDNGTAEIKNSRVSSNFAGVDILFNSTVNISFSDILNNQDDGVRTYGNNSTINIANSNIFNNGAAGIRMYEDTESIINAGNSRIYGNHSGGAINNSLIGTTTAINNWWGDNSGPYHEILNPSGLGNKIEGAVLFNPWVGKEY